MPKNSTETSIDALLAAAERGGAGAPGAARRAAFLAETLDPERARRALRLAAKLEPLDPAPKLALARLHAEIGEIAAAKEVAREVFAEAIDQAARARASFMLGELARAEGDHGAARDAYGVTAKIEETLLSGDRDNVTAARWFARARGRLAELDAAAGDGGRARPGAEGALSILRGCVQQGGETPVLSADIADAELRLGALDLDAGEANTARRRFAEAIGRYEALTLIEPKEPHWRAVLADAWALAAEADLVRGAQPQARDGMDKAIALRTKLAVEDDAERWALAGAWRLRAALLAALEDNEGAATSLAQARLLAERICAEASEAQAPARFLLHTLLDQADHALRCRDLARAGEAAQAALSRAEAFARADGASPVWYGEAAACWDRLGERARLSRADAQGAFARTVEFRRLAIERGPGEPALTRALSSALLKFGQAALRAGETHSARQAFDECAASRLALAEAAPGSPGAAHDLAVALEHVGLAAEALGDRETARHAWEDELSLAERIFPDERTRDGLRFRAIVEGHLANLGGLGADAYRSAALARLDLLAHDGALSERDKALRKQLWRG